MSEPDWALARHMRESAERMERAASNFEHWYNQLSMLLDPAYGGTAPALLEALQTIKPPEAT